MRQLRPPNCLPVALIADPIVGQRVCRLFNTSPSSSRIASVAMESRALWNRSKASIHFAPDGCTTSTRANARRASSISCSRPPVLSAERTPPQARDTTPCARRFTESSSPREARTGLENRSSALARSRHNALNSSSCSSFLFARRCLPQRRRAHRACTCASPSAPHRTPRRRTTAMAPRNALHARAISPVTLSTGRDRPQTGLRRSTTSATPRHRETFHSSPRARVLCTPCHRT